MFSFSSLATFLIFIPPQNDCFLGYTRISLYVCVSVFVQNTTFCQSAGEGIKSHTVTVLLQLTKSLFGSFLPIGVDCADVESKSSKVV